MIKTYNEDCIKILEKQKNKSIDLIFTDPPYLINQSTTYNRGSRNKDKKEISIKYFEDSYHKNKSIIDNFFKLSFEKLKDNHNLIIFSHSVRIYDFIDIAKKNNFVFSDLIVWHKNNYCMHQFNTKPIHTNEYLLLFRKSNNKLQIANDKIFDYYYFDNISGMKKNHPNAKPYGLIYEILNLYKNNNKYLVFDAFMGGGIIGRVCKDINIDYIGCEINTEFYEIAKKCIEEGIYLKSSYIKYKIEKKENEILEYFKKEM